MWVCALETTSRHGSAALLDPDGVCHGRDFPGTLNHVKDLFPTLISLCDSCAVERERIDLFAVNYGPGSYTGIRIGVTAAKTLAFALKKKVAAVNGLDVLYQNCDRTQAPFFSPVIDAKINQVYAACYRSDSDEPVFSNFVGTVEELAEKLPPETMVFGDGALRYRRELKGFAAGPDDWSQPTADHVAILGRRQHLETDGAEPHTLSPLYLRIPEAERMIRSQKELKERNKHE